MFTFFDLKNTSSFDLIEVQVTTDSGIESVSFRHAYSLYSKGAELGGKNGVAGKVIATSNRRQNILKICSFPYFCFSFLFLDQQVVFMHFKWGLGWAAAFGLRILLSRYFLFGFVLKAWDCTLYINMVDS